MNNDHRNLSENVTWGKRKSFQDGNVSLAYKTFLGYEKGENGRPKIVEEEAVIIRLIYKMFLQGVAPKGIARQLTESGIPTPAGKTKWSGQAIVSILTNEKYKGDALLQKTYTTDYLSQKVKKNEGEIPQYYVTNSHEGIIDRDVFDAVQYEVKQRQKDDRNTFSTHHFSSRAKCGICGEYYGSRVLHSGTTHSRKVWQCKSRYTKGASCPSQNLTNEMLEEAFLEAFNILVDNRDDIIEALQSSSESEFNLQPIAEKLSCVKDELQVVVDVLRSYIDENAQEVLDQAEYQRKFEVYAKKFDALKNQKDALEGNLNMKRAQKAKVALFIAALTEQPRVLEKFEPNVWYGTVDFATITEAGEAAFTFKGGNEVTVPIGAA